MDNEEPRDRLQVARLNAGLTRSQLAVKLGRAASTIRAHETGQNRIQPDAAAAYGKELGVNPSWILYGTEDNSAVLAKLAGTTPELNTVPVVGEIFEFGSHYNKEGEESHFDEKLIISLSEYADDTLVAYVHRSELSEPSHKEYLIVAPHRGEFHLIDEVVLRRSEGQFYELAVWKVGAEKDWLVLFRGSAQSHARDLIKVRKGGRLDDFFTVVGIVVARLSVRRRHREAVSLNSA